MGKRYGGRAKGTPNKATVEKEAAAVQAHIDAADKARKTGDFKHSMTEMMKAVKLAEGFAGACQPAIIKDAKGKMTFEGGDIQLFGAWYDRWFKTIEVLAKYQMPQMKPIDAPAPPPDPDAINKANRRVIKLRIFDGGREVPVLGPNKESA